jgi:hypothetical protein
MTRTATIVERIARSEIHQDHERAFSEATQLPVALRPVEVSRFTLEGKRYETLLRDARQVQSLVCCLFGEAKEDGRSTRNGS